LLGLVFVVPALLLGGKLGAALIAQAAASAIVMLAVGVFTGKMRLGMFRFDPGVLTTLFKSGSSFMIFGFALALQPNVDMLFLSKLSSAEVVGWQAAAQRVMSVVMMPASAVVAALYPTLARLHAEDPRGYRETTSRALQATFVLAVPMALGCALYRDIATQLFSRKLFGPIQMNLLVLSALVFLLYVSMPLGAAILAAGRQRRFAVVQTLCVIVSLVLDPLLIPLFQRRYNNGGIGVCVAGVVSEVLMVGGGIFLIPEGVIDRPLLKSMGKGILAGAAMIGVARILNGVTPYAAGPVVLVSYFVALFLVGGVDRQQIESARQAIAQKVRARTS
jgi:O-antigen/teichoic acid export membrane protein